MGCRVQHACLAVAVWFCAALTADAAAVDELRTAARETYASVRALHVAYARMAARDAKKQQDEFFRVMLLGPDEKPLLEIILHCRATRCLWGTAWSVGPSAWANNLEAAGLEVVGKWGDLAIRGEAVMWSAEPWSADEKEETRRVTITLSAVPQGGGLASLFAANPHRILQFAKSGTVRAARIDARAAGGPEQREVDLAGLKSSTLAWLCRTWEHDAIRAYRQIRAIEHARLSNLPFEQINGGHPLRLPKRPRFGKPATAAPPQARKPRMDEASLDDVLDDESGQEDGDEFAGLKTPLREDEPEIVGKRLGLVREILGVMRLMLAAVANQSALGSDPSSFTLGNVQVEDPEFGPWYGHEPLPRRGPRHNIVPAGSGGAGPQFWPYVTNWWACGPFRGAAPAKLHMPDIFPFSQGILDVVAVSATLMSGTQVREQHDTPDTSPWRDKLMEPGSEMVRPWRMTPRGHGHTTGLPDSTFYLATTIRSEEDTELWAGGRADDVCLLWVNEQLVSSWPAPGAVSRGENTALFRLKLRKGENRVVARLDNDERWTGLSLRLCLRGKPRTAAQARRQMAAAREKVAEALAGDAGIFGWRRRTDGCFENARPPLSWDIRTGTNVRWRKPLGPGKSHPVIAGDRLFVSVDPIFLVCLDKHSGEQLWEREMNILELTDPALFRESEPLRRAWQDAMARADRAAESKQADADTLRREAWQLRQKWWDFVHKNGGVQKQSLWRNYVGHMFAAPVTDGRHVWVKCAAGVTACFDIDGNRKWMVKTDYADNGFSWCSSPVLIDGKLILELPLKGENYMQSELKMVCLDAASGKLLWEVPRVHNMNPSSSPVPLRLSNGRDSMAVVVTGGGTMELAREKDLDDVFVMGGTVLRADDGKVLIENLGVSSSWSSPSVLRDRVFHVGHGYGSCTRFMMVNRDVVGAQRIWTRRTRDFDGGLVHHDGILYGLPGGQFAHDFQFLDAGTGMEIVKPVNINTFYCKFGRAYSPPSCAGGYVYISDDGTVLASSVWATKLFVFQPGRLGRLVARNFLEPNMMPPLVFDEDRIYSRSNASVICLGHTGKEGVAAEAEMVARTLLEDIPMEPPSVGKAREVPPIARPEARVSEWTPVPVTRDNWYLVGPYPAAEADAVLKAMGGPALGEVGDKALYRGKPLLRQMPNKSRSTSILSRTNRNLLNLALTPSEYEGKVGYYYWVFHIAQERTLRLLCDRADADLWLSGKPVRNQDRLKLGPGHHALLIRYVAPDSLAKSPLMDLRLLDSPDAEADLRFWRESVETNRAHLERVIALCPESATAAQAKKLLGKL